jgi:hypothetical protein
MSACPAPANGPDAFVIINGHLHLPAVAAAPQQSHQPDGEADHNGTPAKSKQTVWAEPRAAAAHEFAMIASVFVLLCLAFLDVGLLLWNKGVLQHVAGGAARCAAIASAACSNLPQFAVTSANNRSFQK